CLSAFFHALWKGISSLASWTMSSASWTTPSTSSIRLRTLFSSYKKKVLEEKPYRPSQR
ncbi:hypothetical protein V3C99_005720, partial [Haemonchus contortus]